MKVSQIHGIGLHVRTLETLAERCGVKAVLEPKATEAVDEFEVTKQHMYRVLKEARDMVKMRQATLHRRGHCHETIRSGQSVRLQLRDLKVSLARLQRLHRLSKCKSKLLEHMRQQEQQLRLRDIRSLKRLVDELKELFESGNAERELRTLGVLATEDLQMDLVNAQSKDAHQAHRDSRELSAVEEAVLKQWRRRDEEHNKQIKQVGEIAERLYYVGQDILEAAELQQEKQDRIFNDVEKATNDAKLLEERVSKLREIDLETAKQTTVGCKVCLCIALFVCVSFVYQRLLRV